ncbi:MAG: enolase C-terminal domain-like protein, partial [Campylobacterota bacterium]|nr:enolase C-terminal domain-like protein [Campylobacterota bacterium]
MTIVDMQITEESIPLKTPFITALRHVNAVEFVRVTLFAEEGLCGIGEAPPTKAITGEDQESITLTIRELIAPCLLHHPFHSIDEAQEVLHASCKSNSSAKAAVDIALYDLFAKKADQPLYTYLGGRQHPLSTDVTISLNAPEQMAKDAEKAIRSGFDILKIKVGGKDGKDSDRIRAVRRALPDAELLIDANQAWSEAETLEIIEAISDLNITLIEQPVSAEELESMQHI